MPWHIQHERQAMLSLYANCDWYLVSVNTITDLIAFELQILCFNIMSGHWFKSTTSIWWGTSCTTGEDDHRNIFKLYDLHRCTRWRFSTFQSVSQKKYQMILYTLLSGSFLLQTISVIKKTAGIPTLSLVSNCSEPATFAATKYPVSCELIFACRCGYICIDYCILDYRIVPLLARSNWNLRWLKFCWV